MSYHFYTTSKVEKDQTIEFRGGVDEGTACHVYYHRLLYQMHNTSTGHHYYTMDPFETGMLPSGFVTESPPDHYQWEFDAAICQVLESPNPPNLIQSGTVVRVRNPDTGDYLYLVDPAQIQEAREKFGYVDPTDAFLYPVPPGYRVVPFNRFLNPTNGDHYYSTILTPPDGYHWEAVAFNVFTLLPFVTPLYRFRSTKVNDHFYTTDYTESLLAPWFVYDTIACQVLTQPQPETVPLFRLSNPVTGDHLMTTSQDERIAAVADGYKSEGITGEVFPVEGAYTTPLYRVRLGDK